MQALGSSWSYTDIDRVSLSHTHTHAHSTRILHTDENNQWVSAREGLRGSAPELGSQSDKPSEGSLGHGRVDFEAS